MRDLALCEKFNPDREAMCGSGLTFPAGTALGKVEAPCDRKEAVLFALLAGVAGRVEPAGRAAWLAPEGLKLLEPLAAPGFGVVRFVVVLPLLLLPAWGE